MSGPVVTVVGGGLAGSEAAWQLARAGWRVDLFEMRPRVSTPAHRTDRLAEIVCTNSFKSEDPETAHGLLKEEMRRLGCRLLEIADGCRVPAGSALAVDRERFAAAVTREIEAEPRIRIRREEVAGLPAAPAIVATGPLTSDTLSSAIRSRLGESELAFYDAIAPIVSRESIDEAVAFAASRWGKGDADYLNCPLDRSEYAAFVSAVRAADVYEGHDWDAAPWFEGCLPIEVLAARGDDTLRFGPMRPVGLADPRTGRRPWAVVQLRREDRAGNMWNLVGFQTRLRVGEQARVFRMIPGLGEAEFLRWGSIHRNAYLNAPRCLTPYGAPPGEPALLFAGQLTGVEGYTESIASGLLAARHLDCILRGAEPALPPPTTMLGGLCRYLREADPDHFQPMNANFGLVDPPERRVRGGRGPRRRHLSERALRDLDRWLETTTDADRTSDRDAAAGVAIGAGARRPWPSAPDAR